MSPSSIFGCCLYSISAVTIVFLTWKEYQKRVKYVKILSWNGRVTDSNVQMTTSHNHPNIKKPRLQSSKFQLAGSLHYMSMFIYFASVLFCLSGILFAIEQVCNQFIIATYMSLAAINKASIVIFQWNRYQLCFTQDIKNANRLSISNEKKRIYYCVYCLAYISVTIMCIGGIWYVIKLTQNKVCGAVIDWQTALIGVLSLFIGDWSVLLIYFVTILSLSSKLRRFMDINTNNNISNSKNNKKKNNSNNNQNDSLQYNIYKLRYILIRILVCSLMLEIPLVLGVISSGVEIKSGSIIELTYILVCLDAICNVIFVSLMFEHNNQQYKTFLHYCCCDCKCFGWLNKYELEKNLKNSIISDENTNANSADNTENHDSTVNIVNSTFGVEKSDFASQPSRPEVVMPHSL